jgi:hypothetical protein
MTFTADAQPMGTTLRPAAGDPIAFTASSSDTGATLDLVTSGGTVVASSTGTLSTERPASADERWYFVRVLDASGRSIAYSSPVWVELAG